METEREARTVGLDDLVGRDDCCPFCSGGGCVICGGTGDVPVLALTEKGQQEQDARDAARYRWLRARDLETIHGGGVFAGMTPSNVVLNGDDLDREIDAAMEQEARFIADLFSTPNAQVKGDAEPKAERSALEPVVGPENADGL